MKPILAKTAKSEITLERHTADVVRSVRALFGSEEQITRLGERWLAFFTLDDYPLFFRTTLAAAAFHDWGKANDGFQDAVYGTGRQLARHEHLGGLMLGLDAVDQWLRTGPDMDTDVLLAAVISHHLKVNYDTFAERPPEQTRIRLFVDHDEFGSLLELIQKELRLRGGLTPLPKPIWQFGRRSALAFSIEDHRERIKDERLYPFEHSLSRDEQRNRLMMAVRSALIAADAVGSAIPRVGLEGIERWIGDAFDPGEDQLCSSRFVEEEIIDKRVRELRDIGRWNDTRGVNGWSDFQIECSELPDRALLLAPCGSGKTLAAWRWIAAQCRRPVKRVIFLYPTRATATEGFRDYVSWAPESDAALMHGSAEYDLQDMFENPTDPGDDRHAKSFEVEQRLYALGFWTRCVFSATVDQFLAFMQHAYSSTCLLPLLADSVVVFDEVHSFDTMMYAALKEFLQAFNIPVLCMTATLPNARKIELKEDCGLEVCEDKDGDLQTVADAPRYRLQVTNEHDLRSMASLIRRALSGGKRVLWVVNQVKRAQEAAKMMAHGRDNDALWVAPSIRLFCYHSRFKLEDRKHRHEDVVMAFRHASPPALAITTQVCEMSLDMDADVLITEYAPVTALIQRMGRCNRELKPRVASGHVIVYRPENDRPYDAESLTGVDQFLLEISGLDRVNQIQLEAALAKIDMPYDLPRDCQFTASGPYAMAGELSFRDIDEFTVPAILDRDIERFLDLHRNRLPTNGLIVSVPKGFVRRHPYDGEQRCKLLPPYLAVVPGTHYDATIGFCDEV